LNEVEPVVDASACEPAQVVFGFRAGRKTPLTRKLDIMPVTEVDVTLPCPHVRISVALQHTNEGLVSVRSSDPISRSVFIIGFHSYTSRVCGSPQQTNLALGIHNELLPRILSSMAQDQAVFQCGAALAFHGGVDDMLGLPLSIQFFANCWP
jgi:hypothetical protein